MNGYRTFADLAMANSSTLGNAAAFTFTTDPRSDVGEETITFAQLDARARRIAARLLDECRPGDRVLLLHPPGLRFVESFLGAVYAGLVAVPAPAPDNRPRRLDRHALLARDAAVGAVLTERAVAPDVAAWAAGAGLDDLTRVVVDGDDLPPATDYRRPDLDADSLVLLQYTSGSTSLPRGVQVDHGNLLANLEATVPFDVPGADVCGGGWLPTFHDFGLVIQVLRPLALGYRSVLMPPATFLRRPQSWFHLIHRHGVTNSAAPNFAYELCVRRVRDEQLAGVDLAGWRNALNGAEPVQARTMRAFRDRFARFGLRPGALTPGYGLAEATLLVSGSPPLRGPVVTTLDDARLEQHQFVPADEGREVVSTGRVVDGCEVRIVDPDTSLPCAAGRIGEVWLRGPSVSRGYWARPELNEAVFQAHLAGDDRTAWLRTGDLGALHDGELYVTGRLKEVVIVAGRSIYPTDVEAEARVAHPVMAGVVAAAFGAGDVDEQLVVALESPDPDADGGALEDAARAIRDHVNRAFGVSASVVLVPPGAIPRTTSGKIRRVRARQLLLDGRLPVEFALLTPALRRLSTGVPVSAAAP